eukprot:5516142-Pleurochrysis_carterae.AAC.1
MPHQSQRSARDHDLPTISPPRLSSRANHAGQRAPPTSRLPPPLSSRANHAGQCAPPTSSNCFAPRHAPLSPLSSRPLHPSN